MPADALSFAIKRLATHESLDRTEIAAAFDVIMRGEGTMTQVAALLMALRVKGETPAEIAGVVQSMRDAMLVLPADDPDGLVDTCGTGGGAITTFNISTASALLAAGAGVRVAKHGNRSFSSRSGSADVLEALGVRIDTTPEVMARALREAGIVFMYAPLMHPALRHVGPVRRELAVPTVMNIVGPLANPARAGRQVVGVAEPARLHLLGEALAQLGSRHAMVVYGEPGLDEISPLGPTHVVEVIGGSLSHWTIDPACTGYGAMSADDLVGGDPDDNARLIELLLRGGGAGPPAARAALVLNAAAALYVSGSAADYQSALDVAHRALESGKGHEALLRLRAATSGD